jgi:DNA-directed RNA polymerase specialized sigma subunit
MAEEDANPVAEYFDAKVAAQTERKKNELDIWNHWQANGQKPEHLQPLLKLYEPVIGQHMKKKPPMVPASAYKAELQAHAIKAFQSYDPARGTTLNTHVNWGLKKAPRYGNLHANLGYLPEAQSALIAPISKATDILVEELGRPPTAAEIHAQLQRDPDKDYRKITVKRIQTVQANNFRDIPMSHSAGPEHYDYSTGNEPTTHGFEDQQIAVAQHILPDIFPNNPLMHELFHHTFGTNGYNVIASTGALAKKLGKSQSQISRMKSTMGNTLRKHMGLDDPDE